LISLTEQPNRSDTMYEENITKTKISHLLYMDDLKLFVKSEEELRKQVHTVKILAMISIWNLDLKIVLRLHLREAN